METIQPIINGKVNPNLTLEIFKSLTFDRKRDVIWNIIVSMQFAHCFDGIDARCFEKKEEIFKYDQIQEEGVDEMYEKVQSQFQAIHNQMLAKTQDLHFGLGKKIYEVQKELGFGGLISLDVFRMMGYIEACGSWNDFNSKNVSRAISSLDKLAPKKDYGVNNPNTGSKMHQWKTCHGCEYVMLVWDFVDEKDLERIKSFYENDWTSKGRSCKVDSIRIEVNELGDRYFSVELIWWWD